MSRKGFAISISLLLSSSLFAASPRKAFPAWADKMFSRDLKSHYARAKSVQPPCLYGDFNGDKKGDVAVLIKEKSSGKTGIAILLNAKRAFVIGAGTPFGNGGDDFSWMDKWSLEKKGKVFQGADEDEPPTLRGDAFLVEKTDSASALVFWDGKQFQWYQQGD